MLIYSIIGTTVCSSVSPCQPYGQAAVWKVSRHDQSSAEEYFLKSVFKEMSCSSVVLNTFPFSDLLKFQKVSKNLSADAVETD